MKIKIILRAQKKNKDGQSPLMLRFSHNRTTKMVSLGVSVEPCYWNQESEMLLPDCPNRAALQSLLDKQVSAYQKKMQRLEALDIPITFQTLLESKERNLGMTIEEGFVAEIERLNVLGKIQSANKHRYALKVLSEFQSVQMALEQIDLTYLQNLERFFRERGNQSNSIATRFAILKAIYNKAIKTGKFAVQQNPFNLFQVGALWTTTRKRAIAKDDVRRLIELSIPSNSQNHYSRLARDLFVFSYFTAGMNFGDIARLRYLNITQGRVSYYRHKTQRLISLQLTPIATTIVERYSHTEHDSEDYIFPILDRSNHRTPQQVYDRIHKMLRKVNCALRILGKQIGLDFPLTTYVARHTYATVLKRSGVSVALISESLGHSNLSTTQIYLDSFENEQINEAMQHLL